VPPTPLRAEQYWQQALTVSDQALAAGALVPLATELVERPRLEPFQLRRLLSQTPKHLRAGGPKPNPFLPWDGRLEVARPRPGHVLLLNKFPVQAGHVLLITDHWAPQAGWLDANDWAATATVARDTGGLWFFNSCAAAGASQPHRHLQLLPRAAGEPSCPLAITFQGLLAGGSAGDAFAPGHGFPWSFQLSRRIDPEGHTDLAGLYAAHLEALHLGDPKRDPRPREPYNLLFDDAWFLTVRRSREHAAGFSINALGFAGCLLQTECSDLAWLEHHGPWALLQAVASPPLH
jgi:ATP adenylyltransferase